MMTRCTIFILDAENEGDRILLIFFQDSPSVLKISLGSRSSVGSGKGYKKVIVNSTNFNWWHKAKRGNLSPVPRPIPFF